MFIGKHPGRSKGCFWWNANYIPFKIKIAMTGKMLVKLLLLLMLSEMLLFSVSEGKPWWGRRRRRRSCDSSSPAGISWVNTWHEYFKFECGDDKTIKQWLSIHRNCKEDRIHYFWCGSARERYSYSDCAWTHHYVNDFDQPVNFECPHNGFITGVKSEYNVGARDRRFGFRCCHVTGLKAHSCQTSPYQNDWDTEVNYKVYYPYVYSGYYLHGVFSVHHNTHEDRRWQFEICKFEKD